MAWFLVKSDYNKFKNPFYTLLKPMKNFPSQIYRKLSVVALSGTLLFSSCVAESPDKFFGITVLNTNMISDFGTPRLAKSIEDQTKEYPDIPSSKKEGNEAQKMIENKYLYVEKVIKDIKGLSDLQPLTDKEDTKEIKALSLSVFEMVLPVYKNEYMTLAKLCDTKAPQEQKDEIIKTIAEKYNPAFEEKFELLMEKGKAYASKHNLNVNWN